jgi:hypothetical protein
MRRLVALLLFRSTSAPSGRTPDVTMVIAWIGLATIVFLIFLRLYLTS